MPEEAIALMLLLMMVLARKDAAQGWWCMAEKTCGTVDRMKRGVQWYAKAMQLRDVFVGVCREHQKRWAKRSRDVRGTRRGGGLPLDPPPLVLQPTFHHNDLKYIFQRTKKNNDKQSPTKVNLVLSLPFFLVLS